MLKTVAGVYKNGEVKLAERPADIAEGPVLVTFLETAQTVRRPPDLTLVEVAELRGKLAAWEDDWNAPGMEAYDRP